MKSVTLVAAAAFAAVLAAPAAAAVITFDDLGGPTDTFYGPTLVTQGFSFTSSLNDPASYLVWGDNNAAFNADPDGYTLSHNAGGFSTTVAAVGGDSFNLSSIDLGDVLDNSGHMQGGNIRITFIDALGSTSQTITLDGAPGLQTFSLNRTGLLSFAIRPISTYGTWLQMDNLVINEMPAAVPEPATWAMMIAGFGLAGAGLRRRRRAFQDVLA